MKRGKKLIALLVVLSLFSGMFCVPVGMTALAEETTIEFADYYTDPNVISDTDFFGVWGGAGWSIEPMLNYSEYEGLKNVESAAMTGDYTTAKEELFKYYKEKFSKYSMKMQGNGTTKQYLDYLMYKNQMLATTGAGVTARAVASVENEWEWIELDISKVLTDSTFHDAEKTFTFILTALNKDDSVIEIKSRECGAEYAPVVEVNINGETVKFQVLEDAYISAGTNTYETFGAIDENNLKVAESATSIGKLEDPVDENTFRTYLKFNFDKIVRGDTVNKAVLKVYARNAGGTGKKDMFLFSSGENAWQESTISWGCGDITHNMYSFDGDPMPGWDMTKAAFANARMVTNPIRFEGPTFGALGYYQTSKNEEVMYHLIRMLLSYIIMKPDPKFNNNLSTAQRNYAFLRLIVYASQSPMMIPEVFTGFVKYFKLSGDYLASDAGFNSNNNWGVYESTSLLGVSWMYEEISTASDWEQIAFERLSYMAGHVNMADGGSVESAVDYSTQSTGLFNDRLSSLLRMVGKTRSDLEFSSDFWDEMYKQAKFIMDTTGPGIVAPQWGDDNSYTTNYKSDLVTTGNLVGADDLLWNGTDGAKGKEPDYKSVLYPVKGMAVMRSDWSKNALWLHINNDKARTSHGHADDLSVIVFANGRYLLVDPLIYLYNPADNPIRQWLLGTNAHNTVMINNGTQTMPNKDADPGLITGWESNNAYDYVKMMTETYKGFKHTRDVMFLKNKFWIINDYLEPKDKTKSNQYEQLWHFHPDADISVDPMNMETRTNFGDSDIRVIPVDIMDYEPVNNFTMEDYKVSGIKQDETSSGIKVGYYSAKYGAVSDAEYSSYRKADVKGDTSFNTILFPVTLAEDYDVDAAAIKTDLESSQASALKLDYTRKKTSAKTTGVFYNLLDEDEKAERVIESYSTDGETMYVERDEGILSSAILREGSHIQDKYGNIELIKSLSDVEAISVKWQSSDIYIEAMNELNLDDITVYTNDRQISNVYVNGTPIGRENFNVRGKYVYFGDSPIIPDDTVIDTPLDTSGNSGNSHGNSGSQSSSGSSGGSSGGGSGVSIGGGVPVVVPGTVQGGSAPMYSDVESGRWSQTYIEELSKKGVLSGSGDGTFGPERDITREEFVKVVLEAFKIPVSDENDIVFKDVEAGNWSEKYIKTASGLGIINGVSSDEFGFGKPISRQDSTVIIKRVLDSLGLAFPEADASVMLTDASEIDGYATESVSLLVSQGIIIGNEKGEFVPKGNVSREQVAKIIYLTLEKLNIDK